MDYTYRPGRWRSEIPTAGERDVLDAVERIAVMFSDRPRDEVGGLRDVRPKAIQIYLLKTALGWSFSRIGRRLGGVSLQHSMRLYPRGKKLVEVAVIDGKITPRMVAGLLPSKVFI